MGEPVDPNPISFLQHLHQLKPISAVSPKDTMFGGHGHYYFGVGRSALVVIASALTARLSYKDGEKPVDMILDFGSGYGRVARYLRAGFPNARVEVTDYDPAGPDWCVDQLGCFPMPTDTAGRYDLIWLGSVLTHLPEDITKDVLTRVVGMLKPMGVVVFTTGGRLGELNFSKSLDKEAVGQHHHFNMKDAELRTIVKGWQEKGFGYADYHNQKGYGSALISPAWMLTHMLSYDVIQIHFQEMGWDTAQDVYGYLSAPSDLIAFSAKKGPYLQN